PGDSPLHQGLVQGVRDEAHAKVAQGALAEGGLLAPETIQHPLPALVQHGKFHRIPIADMTVGLQQRGQRQQPRLHWGFAPRFRARALRQRVLKVGGKDLMASRAQKHKELARLAGARDDFRLFRGQRNRWVPHDGLLTVAGLRDCSTYQSTNLPLLSTLYEQPSKQLISVLALPAAARVPHPSFEPVSVSVWQAFALSQQAFPRLNPSPFSRFLHIFQ